jgi:hypothetical protein
MGAWNDVCGKLNVWKILFHVAEGHVRSTFKKFAVNCEPIAGKARGDRRDLRRISSGLTDKGVQVLSQTVDAALAESSRQPADTFNGECLSPIDLNPVLHCGICNGGSRRICLFRMFVAQLDLYSFINSSDFQVVFQAFEFDSRGGSEISILGALSLVILAIYLFSFSTLAPILTQRRLVNPFVRSMNWIQSPGRDAALEGSG